MFREIAETLRALHPSHRQLRLFGVILGALVAYAAQTIEGADVLGGSAAGVLIAFLALVLPRAIESLWKTLMALTLPIGWIVSRLILIIFFYLILSPISLFLRLIGHDPLKRRKSVEGTYWEPFEENLRPDSMGL